MKHAEAVILARVSSKEQEETGYSLPAQEKFLREYCDRIKLSVVKVFSIAESASGRKQRDDFNKMLAYANKRGIKHLVVEKVDRLTRNLKDAVMIDTWQEADEERRLHLVKDCLVMHANSRAQEKLNWGVRIIFAKNYIDNLKEEVAKGMREKLEQGWLPGSPPPGYITVGEKGHKIHVVNEAIAPLVVRMFELYDSGEHSLSTLALEMKNAGLKTRTGRPYGKSQIHKLLSNPFYIGKILWLRKIYEGKQQPLIDHDLFERVQNRLTRKKAPKYSKHNPLFKGMIRCAECRGIITWQIQKGYWYGHCNGYRACSNRQFVRQEQLEMQLLKAFDTLVSPSPAIIEWVKDALREKHQDNMEVHYASARQLKSRHEDLQRRLDIMYEDRVDGRITADKYDQKVKETEQEQKEIIDRLENMDSDYLANLERGIDILELSQNAAAIYKTKSDPDRRGILRDLFSNLSLNGDALSYEYSPLVNVIAEKSGKEKALNRKFELAKNGYANEKEALVSASRSLWLRRPDSNRRPTR